MVKWKRELQAAKVGMEFMDKLVMNFLVTEGFAEAVDKFRLESRTNRIFFIYFFLTNLHVSSAQIFFDGYPYPDTADLDVDLATITDRMVVKKAVQTGDVVDALEKINNMDPEILNKNPEALFVLQQQFFIELLRDGKMEEAMIFAQEKLAPMAEKNDFLEEFERAFSVLVLGNATKSPFRDLLRTSQRIKTARVVNEAILISQNNEKEAKLSSLLKMLAWVDKELDKKVSSCKPEDLDAI